MLTNLAMKKIYLPLLLALLGCAAQAQIRYFAQGDVNLTLIPTIHNSASYMDDDVSNPTYLYINTSSTFSKKPGGALQGGLRYQLHPRIFLEGSVAFSYLSYRQFNKYEESYVRGSTRGGSTTNFGNAGRPVPGYNLPPPEAYLYPERPIVYQMHGDPDKAGSTHLLYTAVAVAGKYKVFGKTYIGIGAGISVPVVSSTKRLKSVYTVNEAPEPIRADTYVIKDSEKADFNSIAVLWQGMIEQGITDQWSVQASFTQYFSALYRDVSNDLQGDKAKMRYVSLGVRRYF